MKKLLIMLLLLLVCVSCAKKDDEEKEKTPTSDEDVSDGTEDYTNLEEVTVSITCEENESVGCFGGESLEAPSLIFVAYSVPCDEFSVATSFENVLGLNIVPVSSCSDGVCTYSSTGIWDPSVLNESNVGESEDIPMISEMTGVKSIIVSVLEFKEGEQFKCLDGENLPTAKTITENGFTFELTAEDLRE